MGGNGRPDTQAPIDNLASARLSPAEAHGIVRQRLEWVAGRWSLKPADLYHLARQTHTCHYSPGEIILPSGVRADCLGLVVRGEVAAHVGQRGSTRLVFLLLPGSTFGEVMWVSGEPSQATLQALTQCEIRFLRRADLEALSDRQRVDRQATVLRRLIRGGGLLLVALFMIVLALMLPAGRKALAILPMSIGQWCKQQGHDSCTREAWQVAANLTPTDPNPRVALGTFYFEQGNVAAAEQAFEAAMDWAPNSPEAYNNLGLIYARQGEHERAVDAFQKALELEPGVAATEHNLALSLQHLHRYDEAIAHYQTALALGGPQNSMLLNMAIAYLEAGQLSKAINAAQTALSSNPDLAPAYTVLGAADLESRQPEKALPNLQRAIALDAGYNQAYYYLGLAYKSLGQTAEAIAAFERALLSADDEVMRIRIRRNLGELYGTQEQSTAH
jgi:tetratricopeptide (TPR) repeat protein